MVKSGPKRPRFRRQCRFCQYRPTTPSAVADFKRIQTLEHDELPRLRQALGSALRELRRLKTRPVPLEPGEL